jgi:hypothetical protein
VLIVPILVELLDKSVSKTPTRAALLDKSVSKTLTRDALLVKPVSKTPTRDTLLVKSVSKTLTRAALLDVSMAKAMPVSDVPDPIKEGAVIFPDEIMVPAVVKDVPVFARSTVFVVELC